MGLRGMLVGYWWESQKERTTRKTKTYVGESWILERYNGLYGLDWSGEWDQWRAVVNTVMNLRVP
jgi:hypothetical protein